MKRINNKTIDNNNDKLNIFNILDLFNSQKIDKLYDKSVYLCNKLKRELSQMSQISLINDSTIIETINPEMKKININNNIEKLLIKKIKLIKNKKLPFNRINRNKFIKKRKKSFFSFEKWNKENLNSSKKEDSQNSTLKYYKNVYNNNKEFSEFLIVFRQIEMQIIIILYLEL